MKKNLIKKMLLIVSAGLFLGSLIVNIKVADANAQTPSGYNPIPKQISFVPFSAIEVGGILNSHQLDFSKLKNYFGCTADFYLYDLNQVDGGFEVTYNCLSISGSSGKSGSGSSSSSSSVTPHYTFKSVTTQPENTSLMVYCCFKDNYGLSNVCSSPCK
jgi:hypothetical protein